MSWNDFENEQIYFKQSAVNQQLYQNHNSFKDYIKIYECMDEYKQCIIQLHDNGAKHSWIQAQKEVYMTYLKNVESRVRPKLSDDELKHIEVHYTHLRVFPGRMKLNMPMLNPYVVQIWQIKCFNFFFVFLIYSFFFRDAY